MTAEELKALQEEQIKLVKELRETVESKMAETGEMKVKAEKLETRLGEIEIENQKLAKEYQSQKELSLAQKGMIEEFEKKMYRMPGGEIKEKTLHTKAFEKFVISGSDGLSPEEFKYLRTDNAPQAGVLAPMEYVTEILKNITEISPMRSVARVRQTTRGGVEIPRRTTLATAAWVGEGGTQTETESAYGTEVINTKELSAYSIISHKMLNDSAFNMESEINTDLVEAFAYAEGVGFVTGSGANQPEGFTVNTAVIAGCTNSGVANNIDADTIIDLTGALKTGYNPVFLFNRTTMSKIRQLKDGNGQYIWQNGFGAAVPNTICGYPYIVMPAMADIAANAYPIAFGDFKRGYNVVDGMNLYMIRDEFTLATTGKIKFVALKSVGGKVVLSEAIKLYKCAA